jgi:histone-lysine N-methyltransferase SETD2
VGGPGASLSSIAGKRDRWDDAPGAKRARVDEPRGGWGGVVRDRDPPPPRGAPPGAGGAGAPPGMGVGGMSAPPGMGVGGMSAPRSVAVPKQQPAPARAPSVASQWNTPLSENFMDDVSKMMAWAMVSYRTESHPLYIPGANYDRLVAKLANSIVEKERAQWHERQMPISSVALEKRLGQYVESQVKHMHAQHRSMQSQNGR